MSELRHVNVEEIEDVIGYHPDIPDNWYVPARQVWTYLAWCLVQIRDNNTFRNDKDMNRCMEKFEAWMEDYAVAFGKDNENEN